MLTDAVYSIIVPTYNRLGRLATCLEALGGLDYPRDQFEVLVCDDGSDVSPELLLARFASRVRIRLVSGPNAGPAAARNRGAALAAGRYLLFTDDDCVVDPGWLREYERGFAAAPDQLLAGGVVNGVPENRYAVATHLIVTYAYSRNNRRVTATQFFNTCNLAVPAEQFHRLGGFSESFPLPAGEDYDFCHRWQHAGLGVSYVPAAVVHHYHPLTLRGFWRQHFNYGRGLYLCRSRIARRERAAFRCESPTFYLGLMGFPMRQIGGAAGSLYGVLVAGSQVATLAGAVREWLRSTDTRIDSAP